MATEIINDLTVGSVSKKLFRFALPFMLSTLLQTAYGLADMAIVGKCVGKEGLSAVSIANQIIWVTTALSIGFTNAGQVIVSQLVGSGKRNELKKTIGTVTTVVLTIAIFITVLGLALCGPVLRLMKTPVEAMQGAKAYLTVVFLGSIFTFGYNLVSSLFRGMGDSHHPLIFVAISSSVNLVLDLIAVAVLGWGVVGAAAATVTGQAVALVISISYLYRNREGFGFDFKASSLRVDRRCLGQLVRLGLPFSLQFAAISISMLFVNRFVNTYGVTASATFGTGTRIEQIPWIMINGIMMASATMIGQNMGAGNRERMKKTVNIAAIVCAVSAAVFMALFYLLPGEIYSLFTDDPEVIEMAPMFMIALVVSLPATCMMCPYQAFIEGIGNARLTMIIALLDGFVSRIAISLILAELLHMGLMGWFLGYGLAAYVNTILSVIYYYSGIWKKRSALI
ncbi:MAG: MATE family efflux transporter [Oscillospiraceae bacterium]|nr:MATE family efflux transporter [Oscillospiraceae bacterium]